MNFRALIAHPGLKLLALFLALIFWTLESAPRREKSVERPFEVPLSLVGIPRDLVVMGSIPDSINVRLRGRPTDLAATAPTLAATLDLSGSRPGEVTLPIRQPALDLRRDVEVVTIEPASISFRLETRRQSIVPIRPYPVGELPTGYVLGEITVDPRMAEISGPDSLIKNVTEVATERVILAGRTTSFQTTVGIVSEHPLVRVTSPPNAVVTVNVIPPPPPELPTDTALTDTAATAAPVTTQ
jgi:YbbR domain-containing protein